MDNLGKSLINGKYKVEKKLGSGSFGEIFLGIDQYSKEQVAIKFEKKDLKCPQLEYEYKLLKYLQNNSQGIPEVMWFGKTSHNNIMVMEQLGYSLEDLFQKCNRKFTMKTVLMLGDQMLSRIQYLHSKNFIHRDIKPDNFMMGNTGWNLKNNNTKTNTLYLIDFGLAKKYKHFSTGLHTTYKDGRSLVGTARYASINNHNGIEQSRRDDLEAIGYVLMYFLRGSLPWQGLRCNKNEDKYEKIKQKKTITTIAQLTKGFPDEFMLYLKYTKELSFEETPNYDSLRKLFRDLLLKSGETFDHQYDWKLLQNGNNAK